MTSTPIKPRSSPSVRERRKQAVLSALGKLIGAIALIVMVAVVLQVAATKMRRAPADKAAPVTAMVKSQESQDPAALEARNLPLLGRHPAASEAADGRAADTDPESAVSATDADADAGALIGGIERIEEKREAIAGALRQYFTATNVEKKAAVARDSARVQPLMERYYQKHPMKKVIWNDLGWTLPIDEPGRRLGYVQATFQDVPPMSVIIEEAADGRFLIDWESSVRYGELPWREFLEGRPTKPTLLRVLASRPPADRDDTYAAVESGMAVIEIRHPSGTVAINASYNPHDPRMAPLVEQLEEGRWRNVPVTLRLAYPPRATEKNAVLVTAVEGRGWLILSQPRS